MSKTDPGTSELGQQGDGNQQSPKTKPYEIDHKKFLSLVLKVIKALRKFGVYLCSEYVPQSDNWTKMHKSCSPLTFMKLLFDIAIRYRDDEEVGCVYKYWLRVEESRVLMRKFLNSVEKPRNLRKLNSMKGLVAKVDEDSLALANFLKFSAKNSETDAKRRDEIDKKYQGKPKKGRDGKEIEQVNIWDWGNAAKKDSNLDKHEKFEYDVEQSQQRADFIEKLEKGVKSLREHCKTLGVTVAHSKEIEVDNILNCVDYWCPLSFINVLENILNEAKKRADFWFLQRSFDKLLAQQKVFDNFKNIVIGFGREINTSAFESKLFKVVTLLVGVAYIDSDPVVEI